MDTDCGYAPTEVPSRQDPRLGFVLEKAIDDPFDYLIGMRDGTVFRVSVIELFGDWLRLTLQSNEFAGRDRGEVLGPMYNQGGAPLPRGIDVRISEVLWAADAPYGS